MLSFRGKVWLGVIGGSAAVWSVFVVGVARAFG